MNVLSTNKLVDLTLLGVFKTEIEKVITAGDKSITDSLGTLPSKVGETDITTWLGYIDAKVAQANASTSEVEGKVNTLIGEDSAKSVRTIAAEETAKIVASAPEAFDTLKEIADWIGSGEDIQGTTAATMLADITKLKGAKTVEGSVLYSIDQAITALDLANTYEAKGTAQGLIDALGGSKNDTSNGVKVTVTTSKGEVSSVAVEAPDFANTYDAKGAASAVQGSTTETVASVDAKVEALVMATEDEVKALFAPAGE